VAVTRTFWASSIMVRVVNAWLNWLRRRLHKASRSLSDQGAIEFSLCDKA
jgi:ABC-type sulfate transport system permease component